MTPGDPLRQQATLQSARSAWQQAQTPANVLRYALVLGTPGHDDSNPLEASRLLGGLLAAPEGLSTDELRLATAFQREFTARVQQYADLARTRIDADARMRATETEAQARINAMSADLARLRRERDDDPAEAGCDRRHREIADGAGRRNRGDSRPDAAVTANRKNRPARILVVDDDPGLLRLLTIRLRSEKYEVEPVASAASALDSAALFRPDLVISDLRMAELDGIGLLKELQKRWPGLSVILLTAHGTIPDAVRATQSGAFAFLTKPLEKDHLLAEVRRALRTSGFVDASEEWQTEFLTRNSQLSDLLAKARMVANTDTAVLLTGESGTGKEPLARAIHTFSARRDGPFVAMDCGLLAPESGAERLAAVLRDAEGGTVFLRNVDALPEVLQLGLAEALPVTPPPEAVGGTPRPGVRVVVTSERRLDELVAAQQFSEGLFDRLNGLHLDLPPLAKRREDIPLLVARFLDEIATESGQTRRSMSPQAMEVLAAASWPGNVRELRQVVREVASLAVGAVITPELVKQAMGQTTRMPSFDEARDEFTRGYLTQLLQITGGNVSQAARLAKRNRTDFYKLLTRHNVSPDEFKK